MIKPATVYLSAIEIEHILESLEINSTTCNEKAKVKERVRAKVTGQEYERVEQ